MKIWLLKIYAPTGGSAQHSSEVGARFKSIIIQQVGKVLPSQSLMAVVACIDGQFNEGALAVSDAVAPPTWLRLAQALSIARHFKHRAGQLLSINSQFRSVARAGYHHALAGGLAHLTFLGAYHIDE